MADPKPSTAGPRSNPLYGGPAAGGTNGVGRTPAWARRTGQPMPRGGGGSGTFSDVASTPPESPARDPMDLPYAYYTVETPPHSEATGASPYYAPPYYVQTPNMSEPGFSNFSSVNSSPARYGQERAGVNYASDSDTQSLKDEGVSKSQQRASRLSQPSISRIDEEDEFPDLERDSQRWVKTVTCTFWIIIMLLVLIIGVAGLVAWSVWKPDEPRYSLVFMNVEHLDLDSTSFDKDGLSTASIYGNITVLMTVKNPNDNFVIRHRRSSLQISYGRLPLLTGQMAPFTQPASARTNFTASVFAWNRPLYGAGHRFVSAWEGSFVNLTLQATLRSRVDVVWKIIGSNFEKEIQCSVGLNSTTMEFVDNTCKGVL